MGRARKKDCLCVYDSSAVVRPLPDPFDVCHKRGQQSRCTPPARARPSASIIACLLSALVYIISPPTKERGEEKKEKNRE